MNDRGFKYGSPLRAWRDTSGTARRYGVESLESAQKFGFGLLSEGGAAPDEPGIPSDQANSPEYIRALNGEDSDALSIEIQNDDGTLYVPVPGGCAGQGYARVYGSRENYLAVTKSLNHAGEFNNRSLRFLFSSKEYVDVRDAWRACMVTAGENRFDDPRDAENSDWASLDEERSVAVKDVTCKDQVGFARRASEIEMKWQQNNFSDYQSDIDVTERYASKFESDLKALI